MVALFAGVAALSTATVLSATAGTLIASDGYGAGWSGVPNAAAVFGTAVGSLWLGALTGRYGRRSALRRMYGIGAVGGLVAFGGAATTTLLALLAGMALLGIGNSAANLSRYAAAELYPEGRKGFGLSIVVWAGTVGALAGPGLIAPAAAAAGWLGLPGLAGPFAVAGLLAAVAVGASATLPGELAVAGGPGRPRLTVRLVTAALRRPAVLAPLAGMVAAHVAMVSVMTMTPLQLHHLGHGLSTIGLVLSGHMIGMFLLAPVSGRIVDRWGAASAMRAGIAVLALSAVLVVSSPAAYTTALPVAVFLLGYGWNLVFVAASSMLSRDLPAAERAQVQGAIDALVWGASMFGSLLAGALFGVGGYALVAVAAGLLALTPLAVLARRADPAAAGSRTRGETGRRPAA